MKNKIKEMQEILETEILFYMVSVTLDVLIAITSLTFSIIYNKVWLLVIGLLFGFAGYYSGKKINQLEKYVE